MTLNFRKKCTNLLHEWNKVHSVMPRNKYLYNVVSLVVYLFTFTYVYATKIIKQE